VVIVPGNNPGNVSRLRDLGRRGVRLVLAAPQVPAGKYARAALAAMGHDAAFGPHFLARAMANVASNETDVKAVVAKVVLGEADAGVVYVTDVTTQVAPRVHTIAIPARFNQIAQYPIAVVKGSRNPALARAFVAYVLSPAGQSVLRRSGFISGDRRQATGDRELPPTVSPIPAPRP
jgi:molybdate transport system substrate-binding protein